MDLGQTQLSDAKTQLEDAKTRSETLKGKFTSEMMDVSGLDFALATDKMKASEDKLNDTKTSLDDIDSLLTEIETQINTAQAACGGE